MEINHRSWLIFLVSVLTYFTYGIEAATKRQRASQGYRLPDNIVPQTYNLRIDTNLDENNFDFEGTVKIKIQCLKATNKVILHSKELNIIEEGVTLKQIAVDNNTRDIPIASHQYAKENDFYIVMLNQRLAPGNTYWLSIPFKGILTEGLAGYYRSSYFDRAANKTKWLSVTQFESTDARRAFPCFDEPGMKATFAISLAHRADLKAISNMPMIESKPVEGKDNWVLDKFQETVPMSTYLVAFMISEFEYSESPKTDCKNVTFRIWARKEAIEQVDLAKQVGPKVLAYFEKYFSTDYPLPKQDMAAIPDFNAGAMENWGLITYRETALLYDPQSSSIFNKHSIASVISHELAHQWFGNLVTMKWWTDLWLNEGFATYVGALGVHHVFPEWKSLDSTAINDFLTVLSLDALKTSHPVSVPIGNPSEIDQIFDTISYKKGSYLLRMMNMFLGEDVFRKSVSNYLKKHRYNNAAQDDLWEALTETAHSTGVLDENISVKMIMDSWTLQTGYPLVTVRRDYKRNTITVTQERFLSTPMDNNVSGNKNKRESDGCWWVPISYTTNKDLNFTNTRPQTWLTCNGSVTFPVKAEQDDWVLLNNQASGLYRVNYDEKNWNMLGSVLNDEKQFSKIDTFSRVQVLVDTLGLAWIGKLDYQLAFDVVNYLQHETEYLPWKSALSTIHDINRMLLRTPTFGYFKKFIRDMLEPVYKKRFSSISQLPDDFEAIKHHSLIVSWSCYYGVLDCVEQTVSLFKSWYTETNPDQNNPIPRDLRSVVYCQALKVGGENYWEFLWERYQNSNVATEKQQILGSLACVKELWLLQRYLQWSIDPTKVRKQDSTLVFSSVAENEIGYLLAKDFLVKQFHSIRGYHGFKSSRLGRYIKAIATQITTPEELNEFQSFTTNMSSHLKEAELSLKQGLESANNNIVWHTMHFESLSRYFIKK